jgi:hypothetical protein
VTRAAKQEPVPEINVRSPERVLVTRRPPSCHSAAAAGWRRTSAPTCSPPRTRPGHGIPYLAPELVPLSKAKQAHPKDQADFDATVSHLAPEQRQALAGLLAPAHLGLAA